MNPSDRRDSRRTVVAQVLMLVTLSTGLLACGLRSSQRSEQTPPFVFRSLDLKQRGVDGLRSWDLQSPEARYAVDSRTIRARRPTGVLYRKDQPSFRISADLATVLNDGQLVVLEGSVELRQLDQRQLIIRGDRLVWTPGQSQMVIDQNPRALDATSQLRGEHLTFQVDQDTLTLQGSTLWDRWSDARSDIRRPDTTVTTQDGRWNFVSGVMEAQGPVLMRRSEAETIQASALQGNTLRQEIDLMAPVTLTLPDGQGDLATGTTRWHFGREQLVSQSDVIAKLRRGTVRGYGFTVDQRGKRVTIPSDCSLSQPGEQLTAQRCSWGWDDNQVVAEGNVVLRRAAMDQITRSPRLEGHLGEDGLIRFGAPGQRVTSTIKLKTQDATDSTSPSRVSF